MLPSIADLAESYKLEIVRRFAVARLKALESGQHLRLTGWPTQYGWLNAQARAEWAMERQARADGCRWCRATAGKPVYIGALPTEGRAIPRHLRTMDRTRGPGLDEVAERLGLQSGDVCWRMDELWAEHRAHHPISAPAPEFVQRVADRLAREHYRDMVDRAEAALEAVAEAHAARADAASLASDLGF